MQTARRSFLAVILCLVCGAATLCAADGDSFVGEWLSFEMGGRDIGDHIKSITFVFRADGTFTASAALADGKDERHTGKYKAADGLFDFTADQGEPQKGKYTLNDGVLTLHDPNTNSWVKFKRAAPKQQ